jgi:DNA-binding SARP family transcriptional activator
MSELALFLLGSPRIVLDGMTVDADTRKAIALLTYLAVTQQQHSRDVLATLLWPDSFGAQEGVGGRMAGYRA